MSSNTTGHTPLPHPIPASDDFGPLVGRNFGGYEITRYVGEGPTGAVYLAEDLMGSRVAVKVMHKELAVRASAERLGAELDKLTRLASPFLPRVLESGFGDEDLFFFVTDELPGTDLEAGLAESGALAPQKALEIVLGVCRGLEAAHGAGLFHGGLKPRNVFLVPDGERVQVKVLDFGCSRLAGGVERGVVVGNPLYMAPEQFGGQQDARTDIYSLGVLMYELFSGALPFAGGSSGQVMMRHLSEAPAMPAGVDEELGKVILRCLAKTAAARYGSVTLVRQALERWAQKSPSLLGDAAGFHVIARAAEARKLKQQALSAPDATAPMPKVDLAELARGTRQPDPSQSHKESQSMFSASSSDSRSSGRGPVNGNHGKDTNNGRSDEAASVEASLEDFISQANASFPDAVQDGWDLHTGDVELVDENELDPAAPVVVRPRAVAAAAQVRVTATQPAQRNTATGIPTLGTPPAPRTTGARPVVAPTAPLTDFPAPAPALALDNEEAIEDLDVPSAPVQKVKPSKIERTEVVAKPRPPAPAAASAAVPWTANPLVIIGGILAAFVIGATVVFFMVRAMVPTQQVPVAVQPTTAAPQVVVQPIAVPTAPVQAAVVPTAPVAQPVAAPAPVAQPAAVAQPVVTPIPAPAAAAPAPEAAPAPKAEAKKHHTTASKPAAKASKPAAEKPAKAEAAEKPASKPAAEKPAKKESKGADWVDPF